VQEVSLSLNKELIIEKNLINGKWVEAKSGKTIEVINPINEEKIATVPACDETDVQEAAVAARKASFEWGRTPPKERGDLMIELANRLLQDIDNLSLIETINSGHPISVVSGEIKSGADRLRFFAGAGRTLEGRSAGEYARGYTSIIRREPIGVAGLITPWNYPLLTAITKMSPALAAGNTIVLKPSEQTPLTTLRMAKIANEIFPPGVINVITGFGETAGAEMAKNSNIDIISLTGGTDTGKVVAKIASDSLKHVHLELGGKAPAIILDDADPVQVAESLKWESFWNAGQDCSAASRIIVTKKSYEKVIEALVSSIKTLNVGDPVLENTQMGPLTHLNHFNNVINDIDRSINNGAKVILGGEKIGTKGFLIAPTILTEVEQKSEIVQREVFGPVVTVQRANDEFEAIDMANDVIYGLGASIYTQNISSAMEASRRLKFGTVWINDHGAVTAEMPWGGFRQSGYGKERSIYSLEDYTQIKHVMIKLPD
jgi:betaine-aldehyde dehydrogenase/aminobutyraldehyde dehydrogenase